MYHQLIEYTKIVGIVPIFKLTNKSSRCISELAIPYNEEQFRRFIWNLYIIFYEGSGNRKRIPQELDERTVIETIQKLRNYFEHDYEHGEERLRKKKYKEIGEIYNSFIGKKYPLKEEDWLQIGITIIQNLIQLLTRLLSIFDKTYPQETWLEKNRLIQEKPVIEIEEFFESKITVFPDKKVNFRKVEKYGELHRLAQCPIFLPTFTGWDTSPEFGDTKSAIYLTSKAVGGILESFTNFIQEIEKIWLKETIKKVRSIEKLMPWSISNDGYFIYGSGADNLLEALNKFDFGVITIILQGYYGEDYTKSFFIIISSYRKHSMFLDSFIDFYLSNIPLKWDWINQINSSLELLSPRTEIAESYSLKSYFNYTWIGEKNIQINKNIIGGIGRNGFGNNRKYDIFDGLIFKNDTLTMKYKLDKVYSWTLNGYKIECPVDFLSEFTISATNHPPTVDEIETGKLVGINKPKIYTLIFDGKGHTIFAINGWGWSRFRKD